MPIRAVFFDLDGTLLDTSVDLGAALNHVRETENLSAIDQNDIREHVSNGATALLKLGFDITPQHADFPRLRQTLLDYYLANIADHTVAFPGIEALIANLANHNIAWGVVTNKPSLYTNALMHHFEFASPAAAIISPDDVGIGKPSPEPLLSACEQAKCQPAEAIYVGDHQRDIECGTNAGTDTIAVGYGFMSDPEAYLQWQATHTAKYADDIWPIVQSYLDSV